MPSTEEGFGLPVRRSCGVRNTGHLLERVVAPRGARGTGSRVRSVRPGVDRGSDRTSPRRSAHRDLLLAAGRRAAERGHGGRVATDAVAALTELGPRWPQRLRRARPPCCDRRAVRRVGVGHRAVRRGGGGGDRTASGRRPDHARRSTCSSTAPAPRSRPTSQPAVDRCARSVATPSRGTSTTSSPCSAAHPTTWRPRSWRCASRATSGSTRPRSSGCTSDSPTPRAASRGHDNTSSERLAADETPQTDRSDRRRRAARRSALRRTRGDPARRDTRSGALGDREQPTGGRHGSAPAPRRTTADGPAARPSQHQRTDSHSRPGRHRGGRLVGRQQVAGTGGRGALAPGARRHAHVRRAVGGRHRRRGPSARRRRRHRRSGVVHRAPRRRCVRRTHRPQPRRPAAPHERSR